MVYVYAKTQRQADAWARGQGLRPRDFRAYGTWSRLEGQRFGPGDRIVVLGEISQRQNETLALNLRKARDAPPVERPVLADT